MAADCHTDTDSNTMSRQHRIRSNLSILLLLHLLLLLISAAAGYPQYGPDYYDEYDEDEYEVEGDDVDQQDLEKMGRMVKMSTNGETFKFDAGTTIRIPCHIENLPESYRASVIWSKLDRANTQISIGDTIVPEDYQTRAEVHTTDTGLELQIAAARASDAGRYKCSLKVGDHTQTLVQTVHIRGGSGEEEDSSKVLQLVEGDEMNLSCLASTQAGNSARVSWSKEDGTLPGGQEREDGPVLRVERVGLEDSGTYVCTASDREDEDQVVHRTVQVTVLPLSPPEPSSAFHPADSLLLLLTVQARLYLR